jgi:cellulose synthase/poly-beta-1,6-N-acetylglucosamine synthase-like glycosyltransferase
MRIIFFFAGTMILIGFFPHQMKFILLANLGLGVFMSVLQIVFCYLPKYRPKQKRNDDAFFSVLVPAHNEPPEILMATLHSLSEMNYKNFEVLVIDNNTKDQAVWRPVEKYTASLGDRFRFFHVDNLSGFKAGALNHVMQFVDPRSRYLAVVDADYMVNKNFLSLASSYFTDDNVSLVQFPQHYRNCFKANKPIADEYNHFFGIFMNMANHFDCVPSTGTVSAYRLSSVRAIGGWRGEMLTEDADIGLRLCGAGLRGVYVDEPVGYGLMPYDMASYRKQKWRWAFGNAQTLKTLFGSYKHMSFRSRLGFLSHLMAWSNFLFLPFAVMATYSIVLLPSVTLLPIHRYLLYVSSLTIFMTIITKYVLFLSTFKSKENKFWRSIKAFVVHMGMALVYSEAWLSCLLRVKSPFVRTNKFISKKVPGILANASGEIFLGVWFLIGALEALFWGRKFTVAAYLMTSAMLFSVLYVAAKIGPTGAYSEKMVDKLKRQFAEYLT